MRNVLKTTFIACLLALPMLSWAQGKIAVVDLQEAILQTDLAQKANVSPRTIHAVEKGRQCRQATKRRILQALGVPWEMRFEYFGGARPVRRVAASELLQPA